MFVNEFHNEEDEPNYPGGAITLPIDDNTKLNANQVINTYNTVYYSTLHCTALILPIDNNTKLNANQVLKEWMSNCHRITFLYLPSNRFSLILLSFCSIGNAFTKRYPTFFSNLLLLHICSLVPFLSFFFM